MNKSSASTVGAAVLHPKSIQSFIKNISDFTVQRNSLESFVLFVHELSPENLDTPEIAKNFTLVFLPFEKNVISVRLAVFEWLEQSPYDQVVFFDTDDRYHSKRSQKVAQQFSLGYDFVANAFLTSDNETCPDIQSYARNYRDNATKYNLFGFTNTAIKIELLKKSKLRFFDVVDWPLFAQCFVNSYNPCVLNSSLSVYTGADRWTGRTNGLSKFMGAKSYIINSANLVLMLRHKFGYVWVLLASVRILLKVFLAFSIHNRTKFKGWFHDL